MPKPLPTSDDASWTSAGLGKREALKEWRDWAASTIAPIEVTVFDQDGFAARWVSHGIGQLRMLQLHAPAQRVVHTGAEGSSGRAAPSIQLVYARRGALKTLMGGKRFTVEPGEFVLLDNTRFYQMEMDTEHEAIDLMMPRAGSRNTCPTPKRCSRGRSTPVQAGARRSGHCSKRCLPDSNDAPLPRPLIAEQVGSLLGLATGFHEPGEGSRHRGQLARQILRRIESGYADPDMTPEAVATACGISKRYLQTLLAGIGTGFVQELNATRLDRASDLLSDSRAAGLPVAEIAFRCGFLDAGYFTRLFRKRFGITPREWRAGHAPQS